MARKGRFWFAIVCAGVLLAQSAVALASSAVCAQSCESSKAAEKKSSCCPAKAPPQKHAGCEGECGKICALDTKADFTSPTISAKTPTLDVPAILPELVTVVRPVLAAEAKLYLTDSSPPPKPLVRNSGLRAPPIFGA